MACEVSSLIPNTTTIGSWNESKWVPDESKWIIVKAVWRFNLKPCFFRVWILGYWLSKFITWGLNPQHLLVWFQRVYIFHSQNLQKWNHPNLTQLRPFFCGQEKHLDGPFVVPRGSSLAGETRETMGMMFFWGWRKIRGNGCCFSKGSVNLWDENDKLVMKWLAGFRNHQESFAVGNPLFVTRGQLFTSKMLRDLSGGRLIFGHGAFVRIMMCWFTWTDVIFSFFHTIIAFHCNINHPWKFRRFRSAMQESFKEYSTKSFTKYLGFSSWLKKPWCDELPVFLISGLHQSLACLEAAEIQAFSSMDQNGVSWQLLFWCRFWQLRRDKDRYIGSD